MRALDGKHRARDDRVGGLLDVPERGDLGEEVLEVAADAGVLVRADERDVRVRVHAWIERGELRDDRAPDAGVAHGDVYAVGVDDEVSKGRTKRRWETHQR